LTIMRYLWFFL